MEGGKKEVRETMKQPLISIIVPVYNSERFLERCVQSILSQTYQNLEVLLIDDGSTDRSGAICNEFAAGDPRVKVIHQENRGIGGAQNAGLDAMTGEFVTFCDNDDVMLPTLVETLYKVLVENGADMSRCGWLNIGDSNVQQKYANDCKSMQKHANDSKVVVFDDVAQTYQSVFSKLERTLKKNGEYRYFHEGNWGKMYKAQVWQGLRFPEKVYAQDIYINTELYLKVKSCASIIEPLYYWVQHPRSVTHTSRKFPFHRDVMECAFHNIEVARSVSIFAKRSYYQYITTLTLMKKTAKNSEQISIYRDYKARAKKYNKMLKLGQRFALLLTITLRVIEAVTYSLTIDKRK